MKKSIVILVSFVIFITSLSAQTAYKNAKLSWGPEYKWNIKGDIPEIVCSNADGYYVFTQKAVGLYGLGTKYIIAKYNSKMEKLKEAEIELKEKDNDLELEFVVSLNDKIYILSSFRNKKLKKNFLFYQTLNKETLQPEKNLTKISEINYEGYKNSNDGSYSFVISPDSTKIAVYYNLPYEKGESEKFGYHIFDNNFNEIYQNKITLPYNDELFEISSFNVSNIGGFNLVGIEYNEKKSVWKVKPTNYKYHILSYNQDDPSGKDLPIVLEGKFINDLMCGSNNNNELIGAGFYSSMGTASIEGSFYIRINPETGEILADSYQKFSLDFMTQNMTDKQKQKTNKKASKGKDVEMWEYEMKGIIHKENGGVVVIGEQYYVQVVTRTSTSSNGSVTTTTTYYYHYNDIILINIDASGEIAWTQAIPKRQVTTSPIMQRACSFFTAIVDDKIVIIFNDHPKNILYKKGSPIYATNLGKNTTTVVVEVEADGMFNRKVLFDAKESKAICLPHACQQITPEEVIIFGAKGNKYKFAKLNF